MKLSTWKDGEHCPECGLHWRFGQSRLDGGKGSIYHCNNDHKWHNADHADLQQRERELFEQHAIAWFGDTPGMNEIRLNPAADLRHHAIVRRGFVAEIRCPLAAWMGGPCGRCGETGYVGIESDGHGVRRADRCPACHGSGRTGGIAKAVCGAQPVSACVLTDREPSQYTNVGSRGNSWYWCAWTGHTMHLRDRIPPDLAKQLTGYFREHDGVYQFHTPELAHAALSAVLVEWGKKSANPGGIE